MKKIFIALLVQLMALTATAQSSKNIQNLTELAKVWGFLKYYHPAVADGSITWDAELLKMTALTLELNPADFKKAMDNWYNKLPKACLALEKTQPKGDSIVNIFDPKNIKKFKISSTLKADFLKLYEYHLLDTNVFITDKYKKYTLDFILQTENTFDDVIYPDLETRLLSLFRYWNIIHYFYPNKYLITTPWEKVLEKYIPLFMQVQNADEYKIAVRKLSTEIEDSHSFYSEAIFNNNNSYRVPFGLKRIAGKYYINYLYKNQLTEIEDYQLGDEVVAINHIAVKSIEQALRKLTPGSNKIALYRDIANSLFKTDTTKQFIVDFKRNGLLISKTIKRYTFDELTRHIQQYDPVSKILDNGALYVNGGLIQSQKSLDAVIEALKTTNKLVLDMRIYPNYGFILQFMQHLIAKPYLTEYNLNGLVKFPGTYVWRKQYFDNDSTLKHFNGKIAVLVNENTQSLGESISAILRVRPNTLIVGSQTAGTTGNITHIAFPQGIQLSYTAVGTKGVNNSFIQKKGVKIDVPVKVSKKGLINGEDELLEKATRLLNHKN